MLQERLLMKNLERFDTAVARVDGKAAFIVTFNTFVLGTLLFKYNCILELFECSKIKDLVSVLLVICLAAVFLAILFAFNATKPYLKSGNITGEYVSLLFFNSVAEMEQKTYSDKVFALNDNDLKADVIHQTHTLALILKKKFFYIGLSKKITMWGTLSILVISTTLLIIDHFARG